LNGCSQPQDFAELLFDDLGIDGTADHGTAVPTEHVHQNPPSQVGPIQYHLLHMEKDKEMIVRRD